MINYINNRKFLKSNFSEFKGVKTDKMNGIPQPLDAKPYVTNAKLIDLPPVNEDIAQFLRITHNQYNNPELYGYCPLLPYHLCYLAGDLLF